MDKQLKQHSCPKCQKHFKSLQSCFFHFRAIHDANWIQFAKNAKERELIKKAKRTLTLKKAHVTSSVGKILSDTEADGQEVDGSCKHDVYTCGMWVKDIPDEVDAAPCTGYSPVSPLVSQQCHYCSDEFPDVFSLNEHLASCHTEQLSVKIEDTNQHLDVEGDLKADTAAEQSPDENNTLAPDLNDSSDSEAAEVGDMSMSSPHMDDAMQTGEFTGDTTNVPPLLDEGTIKAEMVSDDDEQHILTESNINYQCDICKQQFTSKSALSEHELGTHYKLSRDAERVTCHICNKRISKENITRHIKKVHTLNGECMRVECLICKKLIRSDNIRRHVQLVHKKVLTSGGKLWKEAVKREKSVKGPEWNIDGYCNICEKYIKKENLGRHIRKVHTERQEVIKVQCLFCTKQIRKDNMKRHLKCVHKKDVRNLPTLWKENSMQQVEKNSTALPQYSCTCCGKTFTKEVFLKEHISVVHEKRRNYRCSACSKEFHYQSSLRMHKWNVHKLTRVSALDRITVNRSELEDARILHKSCPECRQSFRYTWQLVRHIQSGHGEGTVAHEAFCNYCGDKFARETQLRWHVNTKHGTDQAVQCPLCSKTCKRGSVLNTHFVVAHESTMYSMGIWENFIRQACKDVAGAVNQCRECGLSFQHSWQLERHTKSEHETSSISGDTCPHCTETFLTPASLQEHVKVAHDNAALAYECPRCLEKFASSESLETHLASDHDNENTEDRTTREGDGQEGKDDKEPVTDIRNYICSHCGERFLYPFLLQRHTRMKHEKIYNCTDCGATIKTYNKWREHVRLKCGREKKGVCPICGKSFSVNSLRKHVERHSIVHSCTLCSSTFRRHTYLVAHMKRAHMTCCYCNAEFTNMDDISQHISETHADILLQEMKFTCEVCGATFKSKSGYKHHQSSAPGGRCTGEKYPCTLCEVVRDKQRLLLRHARTVHRACGYCFVVFESALDIPKHIRTEHLDILLEKSKFSCESCGTLFTDIVGYMRHKKRHKKRGWCGANTNKAKKLVPGSQSVGAGHQCGLCPKIFKHNNSMRAHVRVEHMDERYNCPVCARPFKTHYGKNQHMANEHGNRHRFACHICPKAFSIKFELQHHVRVEHFHERYTCNLCGCKFKCRLSIQRHMKSVHSDTSNSNYTRPGGADVKTE